MTTNMTNAQRAVATYKIAGTLPALATVLEKAAGRKQEKAAAVTYARRDIVKARTVLDRLLAEADASEVSYTKEVSKQVEL